MKNSGLKVLFTVLLLTGTAFFSGVNAQDPPPPPPPGGGHGSGSNQTGGAAPLDGGLSILLAMGLGYGGKKLYNARKKLVG